MEKQKCGYCGKEYDISLFGTLDNGSDACFKCIEEEDIRLSKKEKETTKNTEEKK